MQMLFKMNARPMYDSDGGGAGAGGGAAAQSPPATPTGEGDAPADAPPPPQSGDDAAAVDMEALLSKVSGQIQSAAQAAADAAVKRAGMSPEEKAAAEREQRIADLDKREKEIAARELRAEAAAMLAAKKLPPEALDVILGSDKTATEKNIDAFVKMFDAAVQAQVSERLVGRTPPASDSSLGSGGAETLAGAIADHYRKRG